jgi:hypothetical protein
LFPVSFLKRQNMPVTVLLDAARLGMRLEEAISFDAHYQSLLIGKNDLLLQSVAPYLFLFSESTYLRSWYFMNGWGDSWGVLAESKADFRVLHAHFVKQLLRQNERGEEVYFRFFDPRALHQFLKSCAYSQAEELFGPTEFFIAEDSDPGYGIKYWLENRELRQKRIPLEEIRKTVNLYSAAVTPETPVVTAATAPPSAAAKPTPSKPSKPKWNMLD